MLGKLQNLQRLQVSVLKNIFEISDSKGRFRVGFIFVGLLASALRAT